MSDVTTLHPIVARCPCGKAYSRVAWEKLSFVGLQDIAEDEFPPDPNVSRVLELRNCTCGSTRGLVIDFDLETVMMLLNDTAKRLRRASQALAEHDTLPPRRRYQRLVEAHRNGATIRERERCARIADDVAKDARDGAVRLAGFHAMAGQQERLAKLAEYVAKEIRGEK